MQPLPPRPRSSGPTVIKPNNSVVRPTATVIKQGPSPAKLLAAVARRPLTPEQQLAAVDKVQKQADQRVKLGQQLFKAAEARLSQHQDLLEQVRTEQAVLRKQVRADVAKALQGYDPTTNNNDHNTAQTLDRLSQRLDNTEREMAESRGQMQQMLSQVSAMMEQTQQLLSDAFAQAPVQASVGDAPVVTTSVGVQVAPPVPPAPMLPPSIGEPELLPSATKADTDAPDIFGQLLDQLRTQSDDDVAA